MSRRSKVPREPLDDDERVAAARYGRMLTAIARDLDVTRVEIAVAVGVHRYAIANQFDGLARPSRGLLRVLADALALLGGHVESSDSIEGRLAVAAAGVLVDSEVRVDLEAERLQKVLPLDARLLRAVRLRRWSEVDQVTRLLRRGRQPLLPSVDLRG